MDLNAFVTAAPTLVLRGAKVCVRRLTAADIPMVVAQESDRALMRWIRDPQPAAEVQVRAEVMAAPWRGADGEWLACTVVPHATATPAGIVVCRVTVAATQTMEFGYRLSQDVHRRGFGFEACVLLCDHLFTRVGVRKLVALCVADNEPSWRLMAKLGMQREARLREYTHLDGAWRDEFVYGLLAREWQRPAIGVLANPQSH